MTPDPAYGSFFHVAGSRDLRDRRLEVMAGNRGRTRRV
jgi:hypothetical protein